MSTSMDSVLDIFGMWEHSVAMGAELGVKPEHIRMMKVRRSVPRPHWPAVLNAAARKGVPLTLAQLEGLHAASAQRRASREAAE